MNIKNICIAFSLLLLAGGSKVLAQSKLAINDKAGLIDDATKSLLETKLMNKSIEYTNLVDFNDLCRHKFAEIEDKGNGIVVSMKDCEDNHLGQRNLGKRISESDADEKATILAYNLSELFFTEISSKAPPLPADESTPPSQTNSNEQMRKMDSTYEHDSRYFFAPSSFNLKKGELYYNTIFFAVHDVQYGITDKLSMGMGTTVATIPFYVTPKFSHSFDEKNHMAIGDMLILGTWGIRSWGNLAYATYTRGTPKKNITIGGGHLYAQGDENSIEFRTFSRPIGNLSTNVQISDHIHFISENYFIPARYTYELFNRDQNFWRDVEVNNNVVMGFSGFRFVNKNNGVMSWQVGLFYLFQNIQELDPEFTRPPWSESWTPDFPRFVLPAISFTQKFGKKY